MREIPQSSVVFSHQKKMMKIKKRGYHLNLSADESTVTVVKNTLYWLAAPVMGSQAMLEPSSLGMLAGLAGLALVGGLWVPEKRHPVDRVTS